MDPVQGGEGTENSRPPRDQLRDDGAAEDWNPEGDYVGKFGIEAGAVESDDQRARRDRDAHLGRHVAHGAAVRNQIAAPGSADPADHAGENDGPREQKASGHPASALGVESEHDP